MIGNQQRVHWSLRLEVLVEPREGAIFGTHCIRACEAVARSGNRFQFRRHTRGRQSIDYPARLVIGIQFIRGAVDGERRRRVGIDPSQRTGAHVADAFMIEVAAQELGQHLSGIRGFGIGLRKIAGAIKVYHRLYRARLVAVRTGTFELLHARRASQQEDQSSAGTTAESADVGGVDIVLRGIGP